MVGRESGSDFESELELVLRELIDERVYAERRLVVSIDAVVHDEELAIGRVDDEGPHGLEVPEVHALVKVAVVKHHRA